VSDLQELIEILEEEGRNGLGCCKVAAATIKNMQSDIEKLKDPNVVHINMLRGGIAKPSWAQIKHLYPEHFKEEDDAE
jgi:uracil phosphoribosyltransferase